MSNKVRDVVIFFAIAFGLTFLASQLPNPAVGAVAKLLLCGFGPLVSGLICYRLLKTRNVLGFRCWEAGLFSASRCVSSP